VRSGHRRDFTAATRRRRLARAGTRPAVLRPQHRRFTSRTEAPGRTPVPQPGEPQGIRPTPAGAVAPLSNQSGPVAGRGGLPQLRNSALSRRRHRFGALYARNALILKQFRSLTGRVDVFRTRAIPRITPSDRRVGQDRMGGSLRRQRAVLETRLMWRHAGSTNLKGCIRYPGTTA
jgi:hypothetical protein